MTFSIGNIDFIYVTDHFAHMQSMHDLIEQDSCKGIVISGELTTQLASEKSLFFKVQSALERSEVRNFWFDNTASSKEDILLAIEMGAQMIICSRGVLSMSDLIEIKTAARSRCLFLGPDSMGIYSTHCDAIGPFPKELFSQGRVGIISKSRSLGLTAVGQLQKINEGISTYVGLGSNLFADEYLFDILDAFQEDKKTELLLWIGDQGGHMEQLVAEKMQTTFTKPLAFLLPGHTLFDSKSSQGCQVVFPEEQIGAKAVALQQAGGIPIESLFEIKEIITHTLERV